MCRVSGLVFSGSKSIYFKKSILFLTLAENIQHVHNAVDRSDDEMVVEKLLAKMDDLLVAQAEADAAAAESQDIDNAIIKEAEKGLGDAAHFATSVPHLTDLNGARLGESLAGSESSMVNAECSICFDNKLDCTLNCGHVFCTTCAQELRRCPTCRTSVTVRNKIYL